MRRRAEGEDTPPAEYKYKDMHDRVCEVREV